MSEALAAVLPSDPESPSRRLARETARVAARLADPLRAVVGDDGMLAETARFLQVVGDPTPDPGEPLVPHPLDRLVAALGLEPVELDLILLAGLAEEHEGYTAAFRRVHPT